MADEFSTETERASSTNVRQGEKKGKESRRPSGRLREGRYFGRLSMTRLALPIERSMEVWATTRTWVDTPM